MANPEKVVKTIAKQFGELDVNKEIHYDTSGDKLPRPKPIIKMNLRYPPVPQVTHASHYYRFVPTVHGDSYTFDFKDKDYLL